MPPRYTYWTIILEGQPTAFRAHTQEDLLPTLRQLQSRHPDAVMMWFARGRLWQSPEQARDALRARRKPEERRGPDWRPGGAHQDPRDRFKVPRDEKRRRFKERLYRDRSEGPQPERRSEDGQRPWRPARPRDDRFGAGKGKGEARFRPRGPGDRGGKGPGKDPGARGGKGPAGSSGASGWKRGGPPRGRPGAGRKPGAGGGRRGGGGSSR
jgi:hypothetical protein